MLAVSSKTVLLRRELERRKKRIPPALSSPLRDSALRFILSGCFSMRDTSCNSNAHNGMRSAMWGVSVRTMSSSIRQRRSIHALSESRQCLPMANMVSAVRYVSLSDLASAFAELGGASIASQPSPLSGTAGKHVIREVAYDVGVKPSVSLRPSSTKTSAHQSDVNSAALRSPSSRKANAPSSSSSSSSSAPTMANLLVMSYGYSEGIARFPSSKLLTEIKNSIRRLDHVHVVQCIAELWKRIRRVQRVPITPSEARGEESEETLNASLCRSDDLLILVLRALSKVDLDQITAVHETPGINAGDTRQYGKGVWVHDLCTHLIAWLHMRVCCFDVHASISVAHLLSQQRLFYDHGTLETLADTIECRIADVTAFEELSAIVDCFSRFQLDQTKATEQKGHAGGASNCASTKTNPTRTAINGVTGTHDHDDEYTTGIISRHSNMKWHDAVSSNAHPIANGRLFTIVSNHCAEGLRQHKVIRDSNNSESRGAGRRLQLENESPTSAFFFLRALGKIRFFNPHLVDALYPHITAVLRVRPELYFSAVVLLGRRDVMSVDVDSALAVVAALRGLLERRIKAKPPLPQRRDTTGDDRRTKHRERGRGDTVGTRAEMLPLSLVDLKVLPTVLENLMTLLHRTKHHCDEIGDAASLDRIILEEQRMFKALLDDFLTSFGMDADVREAKFEVLGVQALKRLCMYSSVLDRTLYCLFCLAPEECKHHPLVRLLTYAFMTRALTPETVSKVYSDQARQRWFSILDKMEEAGLLSFVSSDPRSTRVDTVEVNVQRYVSVPMVAALVKRDVRILQKKAARDKQQASNQRAIHMRERERCTTDVTTVITIPSRNGRDGGTRYTTHRNRPSTDAWEVSHDAEGNDYDYDGNADSAGRQASIIPIRSVFLRFQKAVRHIHRF